jgi:phosphoribosyl-ATP pyrophosphohydrolase
MTDVLSTLAETIVKRRGADPATSHTARLLSQGPETCARKFGEEAVEAVVEAVRGDRQRLVAEAADALHHLLVMLAARDVALDDVLAELGSRTERSGVAEKAARTGGELAIARARTPQALARCLALRALVFIGEQHVPPSLEHDGLDGVSEHWIAERDGETLATARVLLREGKAKIQRVAVRADMRGGGIGRALMRRILDDLGSRPEISEVFLDAQTEALPFYEALGFVAEGPEFLDAGIPHRRMIRRR